VLGGVEMWAQGIGGKENLRPFVGSIGLGVKRAWPRECCAQCT